MIERVISLRKMGLATSAELLPEREPDGKTVAGLPVVKADLVAGKAGYHYDQNDLYFVMSDALRARKGDLLMARVALLTVGCAEHDDGIFWVCEWRGKQAKNNLVRARDALLAVGCVEPEDGIFWVNSRDIF